MISTRQSIIEYLQRKPGATAPEISHSLKTSVQNTRHHLSILMEQGVVEIVGRGVSRKQGRPTILYALTSQVQQNNLDGLVHALLEELLQNTSSEERRSLLHSIARRLAPVDEPPGVSMSHRLFRAVQVLNLMHYQARWEAHTRAPRLILGHCPYSSIIAEHPELCQIDQNMLDSMLGAPTVQIEKLARDSRGATFCMFMVKER